MTDPSSPLTSAELADLKAKAKAEMVPMPKTFLRLIDMIERRDAWQKIETAPKDGTPFLGWGTLHADAMGETPYEGIFQWLEEARKFYSCSRGSCDGLTHWQPLPAPPSEALAATEPPK